MIDNMDTALRIPIKIPSETFLDFIWINRFNRMVLWIAVAAVIIQFTGFKYFYPYASYIHGDSFEYLSIAYYNLNIDTYLVGYGRFLRIFSVFSSSDVALTAFQYLLLEGSALFLLFTLFYFYRPGKWVQLLLFGFMIFNPLYLCLANLISSDGFFVALSLIWFALLLWIIHQPNTQIIVSHALVVFVAFTVRYNALIYPGIAVIAFLLSKQETYKKIIGICASLFLCGLFVLYTGNEYKKLTGTWQYSPFGGWLMANNAMYAYRYVDSSYRKPVPQRLRPLDNMIRTYFDSTRDVKKHPVEGLVASTAYMWSSDLPLYVYRDLQFKKHPQAGEMQKWASMGPVYKDYGRFIIQQYPVEYIRYFLWPNAIKYYAPPLEFLEVYNSGKDSIWTIAKQWFGYKSKRIVSRKADLQKNLLEFYPIFSGIINILILCNLACFILLNGFREQTLFRKGVIMAGAIWILNAGFTIFASSAALRFQSFPILLTTIFALLLIDWLWQTGLQEKKEGLGYAKNKAIVEGKLSTEPLI